MTQIYLKCKSGISGDMFISALLDLGIDEDYLIENLKKLNLKDYKIIVRNIEKKGIKARQFEVIYKDQTNHRNINDINEIINSSSLDDSIKDKTKKIFLELAKAESKVHNEPIEEVHFHEVGAIDSIIDIVSAAILLEYLKVDKMFCSKIAEGSGKTKISHGTVDLPVPAVKELLKDYPLEIKEINSELITPTGAAILKSMNTVFTEEPKSFEKRGFGAGKKDFSFPNVLEIRIINS